VENEGRDAATSRKKFFISITIDPTLEWMTAVICRNP
jgi:hypothetical protein